MTINLKETILSSFAICLCRMVTTIGGNNNHHIFTCKELEWAHYAKSWFKISVKTTAIAIFFHFTCLINFKTSNLN